MSLFRALQQAGVLRTLDEALAQSLRRLDPGTPDEVLAAAALASLAVAQGHAGFDPARPPLFVEAALPWPAPAAWQDMLAASAWVATPGHPDEAAAAAPLVLEGGADGHRLLYLRRYREYERRLASRLRRIAAQPLRVGGALGAGASATGSLPAAEADAAHAGALPAAASAVPASANRRHSAATAAIAVPVARITDAATAVPAPRVRDAAEAAAGSRAHDDEGRAIIGNDAAAIDIAALAPLFRQVFPRADAHDRQARAAAVALRRPLLLVTGGPGTGKTTTIARLLVLRIAAALQAGTAPPRIALAAPTGRAAERMAESLRRAMQSVHETGFGPGATGPGAGEPGHAPIDALLQALPTAATTVHRLLGVIPDSTEFRHHADNPLPFDIVVVDEASMVDLPLMCKLAEAVADGAQLVLLGDPDQLPSVEAGDVLAAILAAAGDGTTLADADARALAPLLGPPAMPAFTGDLFAAPPAAPAADVGRGGNPATDTGANAGISANVEADARTGAGIEAGAGAATNSVAAIPAPPHPFAAARIHLERGYRQSEALHLAPLAAALRSGDTRQALALLRGGQLGGVAFHENVDDPLQAHGPALLAHWRALAAAAEPADALRQANRLRLLTALREGPQGARGLNARIEAQLSGRRLGSPPAWFPGRLLLVTENSYRHRLFNGDVGVCLPGADGTPLAWFPGEGAGAARAFHPATLPAHESAFAMTVHKAQGSEFDEVWLQLPARDNRVLSRELLYTGITRARAAVHLAGSAAVIDAALGRHASRVSGLAWRLRD